MEGRASGEKATGHASEPWHVLDGMGAECGGRAHGVVGRERNGAGRMGALSCVVSLHQVLTSRDCGSCSLSVA
eukprot:11437185-Prorocentrum_lima.AAC.1